jgi:hypothetical protein
LPLGDLAGQNGGKQYPTTTNDKEIAFVSDIVDALQPTLTAEVESRRYNQLEISVCRTLRLPPKLTEVTG